MKERRQYSDELKAEAVKMVTRDGMTHAEVARKLGIPKGSIGNWVAVLRDDTPAAWPGAPSMDEVLAENAKLRKELAVSKMETEILKISAAHEWAMYTSPRSRFPVCGHEPVAAPVPC